MLIKTIEFDLLNLGCGNMILPGCVNIDLLKPKNLENLMVVKTNFQFIQAEALEFLQSTYLIKKFKKIFAFFFLEHLSPADVSFLPFLLNQSLELGGEFIAIVPDFDCIVNEYLNGLSLQAVSWDLLSDERTTWHYTLWNKAEVKRIFLSDGFELIEYRKGVAGRNTAAIFRLKKVSEIGTPMDLIREFLSVAEETMR